MKALITLVFLMSITIAANANEEIQEPATTTTDETVIIDGETYEVDNEAEYNMLNNNTNAGGEASLELEDAISDIESA